jgi:hypothetical protein
MLEYAAYEVGSRFDRLIKWRRSKERYALMSPVNVYKVNDEVKVSKKECIYLSSGTNSRHDWIISTGLPPPIE